ncbi:hypothetical protein BDP27DRAFT_1424102 [Rhodocollybia butyracea]|uniref:F-box domain-containing protein n=1 Tax=Rhodocollybia butyracea TaxID=206335 RepID=A0A9P5U509_9AGAR|nr:hypothetical protein BDP27DRAFT_1424102 [Rhodocollybia butyracea]
MSHLYPTTYRNCASTLGEGLNDAADELVRPSPRARKNAILQTQVSLAHRVCDSSLRLVTRTGTQVDALQIPSASRVHSGASLIPSNGWHSLPVELLSEIFPHCLPSMLTPLPSLIMEAPLVLLFVCQKWRAVAVSLPQLWSSLRISLPSSNHLFDGKLIQRRNGITKWLNRSGSLPLSLSLVIHHGERGGMYYTASPSQPEQANLESDIFELIAFLMQSSSRFVNLTIFSLSTMYDFSRSIIILGTAFPALQSMRIVHQTAGMYSSEGSKLSTLIPIPEKSMSKLQSLHLDGFNSEVIRYLTRTHSWSPSIKHLILGPSSTMSVPDSLPFGSADILRILSKNMRLHSFHAVVTLNSFDTIQRLLRLSSSVLNLHSLLHLNLQFVIPPHDALHTHPDPDMHRLFK